MKPKIKFCIFILEVAAVFLLALAAPLHLLHGAERICYIAAEAAIAAGAVLAVPWWSRWERKAASAAHAKMHHNFKLVMEIWLTGLPVGLVVLCVFVACMTILTGVDTDVWPLLLLYAAVVLLGAVMLQVRRWTKRDELFSRFLASLYSPPKK